MHTLALILRACLVVVFATAGGAKLLDPRGSRQTMLAFGVPVRIAGLVGVGLPIAEFACAVALLFQPTARFGALACLLLLLVFSLGVGRALSEGRTPACNCFGQISSSAISWRTLARNAGFAAAAGAALALGPGSSLSSWTASAATANVVASVAVLAVALLVVATLRLRATAREHRSVPADTGNIEPLMPGTPAPEFELSTPDGSIVSLKSLLDRGRPTVLVFASPTCSPCRALLPELDRWASALGASVTIAVIESAVGTPGAISEQLQPAGSLVILTESSRAVAESYHVEVTPTAIGLDPTGAVATLPAAGGPAIEELIRSALQQPGVGVAA